MTDFTNGKVVIGAPTLTINEKSAPKIEDQPTTNKVTHDLDQKDKQQNDDHQD
jgi:hypothetical protein